MQALILAAGRGSRLGERGAEVPKCLLDVGRRPIVEHQLEALADAGVGPVGMVLGYSADEIREVVGIRSEYIINPRWSTTNSLYSFWLARDWVKGSVLVLNGDVLFHPRVLDRLLRHHGDAFAYDSSSGHGREHMKVKLERGRLVDMAKDLPPEEISGENVGILSLSFDAVKRLFEIAERLVEKGAETNWLGAAVCELARERDLRGVDIAGLPWAEIDFSYDLDRARKVVWPAIVKDQRDRLTRRLARWGATAALVVLCAWLVFRLSTPPLESAWDAVDIDALQRVTITAGDHTKRWSLLGGDDDTVEIHVVGPSRIRIDSRLLLPAGVEESAPYVLGVALDGKRVGWFNEMGVPSGTWKHPESPVCKKRRISLDVPKGGHRLRVRLVAADSDRCLVRIHQEEPTDAD